MATSLLDRAKEFQRDLEILDVEIAKLKREYDLFFAGVTGRPPVELKTKVDRLIKKNRNTPVGKLDLNFRLESLISKYSAMCDYWEKIFKARENDPKTTVPYRLGMETPSQAAAALEAAQKREAPSRAEAPAAEANGDRMRKVYEEYVSAKKALGQSVDNMKYENFRSLLLKQMEQIKEKSQCADISFSVSIQNGKVNLKAKPVK